MNCNKAKQINLLNYLQKSGFNPKKKNQNEAWFLSPFRDEKTPSFKIDLKRNIWYDFGEGIGGNTLDFVVKHENCTVKEALEKLSENSFSFQEPEIKTEKKEKNYKILKVVELTHHHLMEYIIDRKIGVQFAKKYCCEVHYTFDNHKSYYAIGFMNDSGGFELRNKYFKGCLGNKDLTSIKNNSDVVSLFESWSDFLSYLSLKKEIPDEDFMILNSTALAKKTIPFLEKYSKIKLFFDTDKAGDKATEFIKSAFSDKVIDGRNFYKNHDDINDFIIKKNNSRRR